MLGSDAIVIATLLFLALSAVVLILMLYTMMNGTVGMVTETVRSGRNGDSLFTSRDDIQNFIDAKAELTYQGKVYALNTDFYKIGRNPQCNLIISNQSVSKLHCVVHYRDKMFILSDLQSKNGTYVNGKQVKESVELHDGDEIRVGCVAMKFKRKKQSHSIEKTMVMDFSEEFEERQNSSGGTHDGNTETPS